MMSTRGVIACALVTMVLCGPASPWALAQQPVPPPAVVVEVAPPEMAPPERQPARGIDAYDVGATVVTVAKAPFNVALCALGTAVGTALFAMTLGSAYRATTRVFEEGCAQKWIVRGDDIRPRGHPGIFPERASEAYGR
jgi:hypothetical protein